MWVHTTPGCEDSTHRRAHTVPLAEIMAVRRSCGRGATRSSCLVRWVMTSSNLKAVFLSSSLRQRILPLTCEGREQKEKKERKRGGSSFPTSSGRLFLRAFRDSFWQVLPHTSHHMSPDSAAPVVTAGHSSPTGSWPSSFWAVWAETGNNEADPSALSYASGLRVQTSSPLC